MDFWKDALAVAITGIFGVHEKGERGGNIGLEKVGDGRVHI
jgi:hypothetical protein